MERYTGQWIVAEENGAIHVMPETDIKPHSIDEEGEKRELAGAFCPCEPRTVATGGRPVYVHNSFQDKECLDEQLK